VAVGAFRATGDGLKLAEGLSYESRHEAIVVPSVIMAVMYSYEYIR
jgi:hypothetical protein